MINLVIAASLLTQTYLTFGGGDTCSLASLMLQHRHRPVAALIYDNRPIKAFKLPLFKPEDFRRDFNLRTGWFSVIGKRIGLSKNIWTSDIYHPFPTKDPTSALKVFDIPEKGVARLITLAMPKGTYLPVKLLLLESWPKPLKIHWLYQKLAISLQANEAQPEDVLDAIARCVGGTLVIADKEYRIDFDPKEFRKRSIETLSRVVAFDPTRDLPGSNPAGDPFAPVLSANRVVLLEAVRGMSDKELGNAFAKEGQGMPIYAQPDSPLAEAIHSKIRAYYKMVEGPAMRGSEQAIEAYRGALEKIDFSKVPHVYFASPLSASVAVGMKGGGTIML
jgi:hypothetical protein